MEVGRRKKEAPDRKSANVGREKIEEMKPGGKGEASTGHCPYLEKWKGRRACAKQK